MTFRKHHFWLTLVCAVLAASAHATETSFRRDDFDPRVPGYQRARPQWAVEVAGSLSALGGSPSIPNLGTSKIRATSIAFEFQPAFFQSLGVLGFGPSISAYPVLPGTTLVNKGFLSLVSGGGQVRYQARFFREQWIVPVVGYETQYFHYRLASGSTGNFTMNGPFFGGMLLLNVLDPSTAAEFYVDSGVSRSYLVAELRTSTGHDDNISIDGRSFYLGVRVEF